MQHLELTLEFLGNWANYYSRLLPNIEQTIWPAGRTEHKLMTTSDLQLKLFTFGEYTHLEVNEFKCK